ncbi:MAG: phosphoribosyl-ATP diphosphatase, partial [Nitrospirota bacterium]
GSYVSSLFAKGKDVILKKVGEEAAEVVIASKNQSKEELVYETADLWFHSLIALAEAGVSPSEVYEELKRRRK